MTNPRQQRNITPGKGDIYTFMDCPDRTPYGGYCFRNSTIFCDYRCSHGLCELGYAR